MSSDPNQVGAGVTGAHQVTFAFPTPDPKTFLAVEGVIHVLNGRVVNLSTQDGFFQLNSRDATSLTFTYHTVSTYGNSPAGAEALVWSRANLNRHDVVNGLLQSCELVEDVKLLHRPITVAT